MNTVFHYSDYKAFLADIERSRKAFERGFRTKLANHLECQAGYVSSILNGTANFSPEQALKAADFLTLKNREIRFFMLLVEKARAGTKELRDHIKAELLQLKEEHLNIKERVGGARILSESEQQVYYSSWHYGAVHALMSLPGFHDVPSISNALKIPEAVTNAVLLFLVQSGIIIENKGVLKSGVTQVHLNRESPLIKQHHTNARMLAIQSLVAARKSDVHYSTMSTLSLKDTESLRAEIVKLIEHYVATVKDSKEETLVAFNVDFHSLI